MKKVKIVFPNFRLLLAFIKKIKLIGSQISHNPPYVIDVLSDQYIILACTEFQGYLEEMEGDL